LNDSDGLSWVRLGLIEFDGSVDRCVRAADRDTGKAGKACKLEVVVEESMLLMMMMMMMTMMMRDRVDKVLHYDDDGNKGDDESTVNRVGDNLFELGCLKLLDRRGIQNSVDLVVELVETVLVFQIVAMEAGVVHE
jgi:hypothetical protein